MRLTDILKPQDVLVPMLATDKKSAIKELVDLLAKSADVKDPELLLTSVLEREATRTTGVGHGLAIPHSKCGGVKRLMVAMGKVASPINFNSIDDQPVSIIVLLVSPPEQTAAHIQCLASISRLMTIESFRNTLLKCHNSVEFYNAILDKEKVIETPAM